MTGRKLIMTFPVTATSHRLADYRARGGYATLDKVLREMRPEQVTKEVAASGILGHGGAAPVETLPHGAIVPHRRGPAPVGTASS